MKTSLFVICILAVSLAACSVSSTETQTSTPTPLVIPDEVLSQIDAACSGAATGVFAGEENIDIVGKIGLCKTMIEAVVAKYGWPGVDLAFLAEKSEGRFMAEEILENWTSLDKKKYTDFNVRIVMYHLCQSRKNLERSGYLTPPAPNPQCSLP